MGAARLYLALSVVLGHCGIQAYFIASDFSVHLFFVVSGFCMALVLNRKYDDAPTFYLSRILRLWPTYAVVIIGAALLGRHIHPPTENIIAQTYFWFSSLTLIGFDTLWWFSSDDLSFLTELPPYTNHLARLTGMQHMWSVGIELSFYLVAPFIAQKRKLVFALVPAAFLVSVILEGTLERTNPIVVRSALNFFWLFALGMAAFWIYDGSPRLRDRLHGRPVMGMVIGAIVSAGAIILYHPHLPLPFRGVREFAAVIIFAGGMIVAFASANKSNVDRRIGDLSYPIYVVHWPLLPLYMRGANGQIAPAIAVVCVSLIAAYLLNVCVEKQVERVRKRLVRNNRFDRTVSKDNFQVAVSTIDIDTSVARNR